MALYLVDYENTGVRGIAGIENLKSTDRLIILYGPKTGSVPFEDMVKMTSSPAAVEFIRTTKTAKNYLDFQLTTYLGYLVALKSAEQYYIISRDSGFDATLDFWQERGCRVERFANLLLESADESASTRSGGRIKAASQKTAQKTSQNADKPKDRGGRNSARKAAADEKENGTDKGQQQKSSDKNESGRSAAGRQSARGRKPATQAGAAAQDNAKASAAVPEKSGDVPTVPESVKKKIRLALKEEGLKASAYRKVYTCMLESSEKSALNTSMVHAFGQETANRYYKQILPAFAAWRNLS